MSAAPPTIIDLKTLFLRQQILILSQPLSPSQTFLASNASSDDALQPKTIDEVIHKVNGLLKKHIKLVYGPQAKRHVAEQVDRLYWAAGERGVVVGEEWAERGEDYRKEHIISQLPERWSEDAESKAPEQASRYKELQHKLKALNEKRREARERVERYKAFKETLDLFGQDGGVQENLVVRNGEIESELEKMRRLMLRVERGLDVLKGREGEEVELMDVVDDGHGNVDNGEADRKLLALVGGT